MIEQVSPGPQLSLWASAPFVALLIAIAVAPLVSGRWWGKYYPAVSIGLGVVTAGYYLFGLGLPEPILRSLGEYVSFIALVGSLYVIAGGIHIRLRGRSTPLANVVVLALGAVLSNIVGTTGASMILIRPYLHVNRYRIRAFHVVFFIFLVSNIGGAMTPVGDPPLFLGYLHGVPFLWPMENLWPVWILTVAIVLGIFYLLDRRDYLRLPGEELKLTDDLHEHGEVTGLHNIFPLAVAIGAVFVTHPPFLREGLMLSAAAGSWVSTRAEVHRKNNFDFLPIKEVSILFLGIFMTMVPALAWIKQNAPGFGLETPGHFFWASGALSSVLDNAPTYLNFLSAAVGRFVSDGSIQGIQRLQEVPGTMTDTQAATAYLLARHGAVVQAISAGAVFFGAMTYIGNGPNLLVRSIAEQTGIKCPSFGGYVGRYAIPVLLPAFLIVWFLFFRS